jgi:hypothetical protein
MRMAKVQLYLFLLPVLLAFSAVHPFYLSVCDLVYHPASNTMQISLRIFTNDLETALTKAEGKTVDLYHPADSVKLEQLVESYVRACLKIKVNDREQAMVLHGFEREAESTWIYLSLPDCGKPQQIEIKNALLYNSFVKQSHIIQAEVEGVRKSVRVNFPDSQVRLQF